MHSIITSAMALALCGGAAAYAQGYGGPAPYEQPAYNPGGCGTAACGAPGPVGYGQGQPTNEAFPPNAAPGQCFTKVLTPEQTETVTEQVLLSPGQSGVHVTPGETRIEEKSVLVKEASEAFITIPATYRTVSETVVIRPAYTRTEVIPAVYDTVTEQVKIRDGYTEWRPGSAVAGYAPGSANTYGSAPISKPEGVYGQGVIAHNPAYGGLPTRQLPTGEVLCLVQVPAQYKTITKQVLRTPARTVQTPMPAETRVVTRQVIDQPARVERRVIPAAYGSVTIKVQGSDIAQPYQTAPVYGAVTKTRLVAPSRFEWKQVECRTQVVHDAYPPAPQAYYPPPPPPPVQYAPAYPAYPAPQPCCQARGW